LIPRTIHNRSFVGVALKLAGTLLALFLVHDALVDRDREQNMTTALKREMDEKQHVVASHDDYAAQLQAMRGDLARLVQRLPSKFDAPTIEWTLRDRATLSGIETATVQVGKERVREGFYADRRVDLTVKGTMEGFVKFMDGLLHDSPRRLVMAMKIEPIDDTGTLRAALTVIDFRYIEDDE
jgi:Tfp pilus assembly protein PilO